MRANIPTIPRSGAVSAADSHGTQLLAPQEESLIKDFQKMYKGPVIDGVQTSAEGRKAIVVIETSAAPKTATVYVVPGMYGSPAMLDARRQLVALGYRFGGFQRATADVIAHAYERQGASTSRLTERTDIEGLITDIVETAVRAGTSDIHMETRGESTCDVFFRVNGNRVVAQNLTYDTAASVANVLYGVHADEGSKAGMWVRDELRDGGVNWTLRNGENVFLRFSSGPIHPGKNFHIVMRVLPTKSNAIDLDTLGYTREQLGMIENFLGGSTGMLILCGPTNSGKSTSLASMIQRLYTMRGDTIKIITAENPVEYTISGACQVAVGPKVPYNEILKGILRQDSDVVVPGEIRDSEGAVVVRDMVLSGRKVLTTLHTYSALWSFPRLREMGVPWELLTMPGFITGIVYQRLVPTLCPECSIPLHKGAVERIGPATYGRLQRVTDFATTNVHVKGDGCEACRGSGIRGRTVVAEFLVPDRPILDMLAANNLSGAEKYWREQKVLSVGSLGVTALAHALSKMHQGLLDPLDVEHQVDLLNADVARNTMREASTTVGSEPRFAGALPTGVGASVDGKGLVEQVRRDVTAAGTGSGPLIRRTGT